MQSRAWYIVLSIFMMGLAGCCDNEVDQVVLSPSGARMAVMFNRNCGATTGFNTQISIVPRANSSPDGVGNALILSDHMPLQMRWVSDSELRVSGLGTATVVIRNAMVNGVSITYTQ